MSSFEAWWKMDDDPGDPEFVDSSGNGHHLTKLGAAWLRETGLLGQCAESVGIDPAPFSSAHNSDALLVNPPKSFELLLWFKAQPGGIPGPAFSDAWRMYTSDLGDGLLAFHFSLADSTNVEATVTAVNTITRGQWCLLDVVWDHRRQTMGCGVDNEEIVMTPFPTAALGSNGQGVFCLNDIGVILESSSQFDDMLYFTDVLMQEARDEIYNGGLGRVAVGPVSM